MTDKLDFKRADKALYTGKPGQWQRVMVPEMTFLAIDGIGAPDGADYGRAIGALYPLAYGLKFRAKAAGQDFVVPPLEAIWWADDMAAFVAGRRDEWRWRAMLRVLPLFGGADLDAVRLAALAKLAKKNDPVTDADSLARVALIRFGEGDCLQCLHIGPYADEAPVLADLHHTVMPGLGLTFNGHHHEIYLGDPRRVAAEKLKTILRQPVQVG